MHDPDALAQASDEQLRDLVSDNLKPDRAGPGLWAILTRPPLAARVRHILIEMQTRVDDDIRTRRWRRDERRSRIGVEHSSDYEQSYSQWYARAVAFRRMVQDRITQIRAGAAEDNRTTADLVRWHRDAARTLVEAIDRHRRALNADVHPEPADQALWKVLDEVAVPDGPEQRPVSVRDLFDTHWSPEATRRHRAAPTATSTATSTAPSNADFAAPAS